MSSPSGGRNFGLVEGDLERPTTPPEGEEEFTDDDGTPYKWDRVLRAWVPQVLFLGTFFMMWDLSLQCLMFNLKVIKFETGNQLPWHYRSKSSSLAFLFFFYFCFFYA